jgi:uncharacterized membrane protein
METYIPVGLTATIVDNIVVAAGYLQYNGPYIFWLGSVPLAATFTWGSILYILRSVKQLLKSQSLLRVPWTALLAIAGALFDAVVERFVPSSWLGWTWIINNPQLGFPARNSVGWFLILTSSLFIQDWMRGRGRDDAMRLLTMCALSIFQTLLVLVALVSLGYFID